MRITIGRWTLGCVLGAALIGVALLPTMPEDDRLLDYSWKGRGHEHEAVVWTRQWAVSEHERGLLSEYNSAADIELARHAFSSVRNGAAGPDIWFAPDVPERSRRAVSALIAREISERGELTRRGPVGVMIVADTATALDHVKLPMRFDRDRAVTTAVLPASSATGNRCVTVIRLRHAALVESPVMIDRRLPLDGCAFTDAYGAPGPRIAEWLRSERYLYARRLAIEQPKEEAGPRKYAWDDGDVFGRSCRGGDDSACIAGAMALVSRV